MNKNIEKIRGSRFKAEEVQVNKQLEITAKKVACLLVESKTTFNDVDLVFRKAKDCLRVTGN